MVRDDGARGQVVAEERPGQFLVEFTDGSRFVVSAQAMVRQSDGSYRVGPGSHLQDPESAEVTIPVVAEELTVEKYKVARARVRVQKRVETREQVVETPVVVEEVVVEHVPINRIVDDVDHVPTVREEADVLVIPVVEEILVVQKQLLVREEVRVFKRRTTRTVPQTVVLRREVVDIQREDLPGDQEASRTGKEHQS